MNGKKYLFYLMLMPLSGSKRVVFTFRRYAYEVDVKGQSIYLHPKVILHPTAKTSKKKYKDIRRMFRERIQDALIPTALYFLAI
jgi:hypothetical protein